MWEKEPQNRKMDACPIRSAGIWPGRSHRVVDGLRRRVLAAEERMRTTLSRIETTRDRLDTFVQLRDEG